MVISKLDLIQFLLGLFQVFQDILAGCAIFATQFMDHIQTSLDLIQFTGRIGKIIPCITHFFSRILQLVHQICQPFVHGSNIVIKFGDPRQSSLCCDQQAGCAVGIIATAEAIHGFSHVISDLFGILQHFAASFQGLILADLQIRLLDLGNLVFQGLHTAQLLAFVHGKIIDLALQLGNLGVFFAIIGS